MPIGLRTRITGAAAFAAAAPLLHAGQGQPQQPQFRDRVDLVRLDVSVLDGDGRPVRGLTAADFTIRDNGRAYAPVVFEAIDVPMVLGTDETWLGRVAPDIAANQLSDEGRLIVILLDDAALPGVTARSIQQSREIARSVVEQLAPMDLAAVVFSGDASGAQNFTNDKERLLRAIERMHPGFVDQRPIPWPGGGGIDLRYTEEHLMRGSIRTLRFVAESLMEAPGRRKALVYISAGVPVQFGDPDDDKADDAREVFDRAQLANVAIYSFNPKGLEVDPTAQRQLRALQRARLARDYLHVMADNTGGFAVVAVNNPAGSVRRVFEENSAYYLVGYSPADPPGPGEFRTIDVRVNRPDVTVRARDGYFTPKPADDEADLTPEDVAMRRALTGLLPDGALPMQMQVAPLPVPGSDRTALVITARVDRAEPAGASRPVDFVITAFDDRGRSRASKRHTAHIAARESGSYEILTRLDVEPGKYEVRLAGHDSASNLSGSVFRDLEVPDFSRNGVWLSGVFVSLAGARPAEPTDALADLLPVVPTTRRAFAKSAEARALVRVHQGGSRALSDVDLVVRLLAADGTPLLDEVRSLPVGEFTESRHADVDVALPLTILEPGPYLLAVALAGADEDQEGTSRQVRFAVSAEPLTIRTLATPFPGTSDRQ